MKRESCTISGVGGGSGSCGDEEALEETSATTKAGFSAHRLFSHRAQRNTIDKKILSTEYAERIQKDIIYTAFEHFLCGLQVLLTIEFNDMPFRFDYLNSRGVELAVIIVPFFLSACLLAFGYSRSLKSSSSILTQSGIALISLVSTLILFEIAVISEKFINPIVLILMTTIQNRLLRVISVTFKQRISLKNKMLCFGANIIVSLYSFLRLFFGCRDTISYWLIIPSFGIIVVEFLNRRYNYGEKQKKKQAIELKIAKLEEDLIQVRRFYKQVLKYIPHGIAVIDSKMEVLYTNNGMKSMINSKSKKDKAQNSDFLSELNRLTWMESKKLKTFCTKEKQTQQFQSPASKIQSKPPSPFTLNLQQVGMPSNNDRSFLDENNQTQLKGSFYKKPEAGFSLGLNQSHQVQDVDSSRNPLNIRQDLEETVEKKQTNTQFLDVLAHMLSPLQEFQQCGETGGVDESINNEVSILQQTPKKYGSMASMRPPQGSIVKTGSIRKFAGTGDFSSSGAAAQNKESDNKKKLKVKIVRYNFMPIHRQRNKQQLQPKVLLDQGQLEVQKGDQIQIDLEEQNKLPKMQNEIDAKGMNMYFDKASFLGQNIRGQSFALDNQIQGENNNDCEEGEDEESEDNDDCQYYCGDIQNENVENFEEILDVAANNGKTQNSKIRLIRNSVAIIIIEDQSSVSKMKRLEDQNEYKMRMLASVSHELRTPLNCSISMLQIMREELLNLEQKAMVKENLDPALHSSKLLLNLINDILDFAQLEAGKFRITTQDFNLRVILRECLILTSIQARMKNLSLGLIMGTNEREDFDSDSQIDNAIDSQSVAPDSTFVVNSDPNRVRQIVLNLLSNALKFTEKGSIVLKAVIICQKPLAVKISCLDTGIGIPQERCKSIFDSFNKADLQNRIKYNQCGAGLGLSISNQLARVLSPPEYANNPIKVESEVGLGSSFSFVIRDQSVRDAKKEYLSNQELSKDLNHILMENDGSSSALNQAEHKSFRTSKQSQFSKKLSSVVSEDKDFLLQQENPKSIQIELEKQFLKDQYQEKPDQEGQKTCRETRVTSLVELNEVSRSAQKIELLPYQKEDAIQQSTGYLPSEREQIFNHQRSLNNLVNNFLKSGAGGGAKISDQDADISQQIKQQSSDTSSQAQVISFMNTNQFQQLFHESFSLDSPQLETITKPNCLLVPRYAMQDKKKCENDLGPQLGVFGLSNRIPSMKQLNQQNNLPLIPFKRETLMKQSSSNDGNNQNYVYSYSLNSRGSQGQLNQQQMYQMQLSAQQFGNANANSHSPFNTNLNGGSNNRIPRRQSSFSQLEIGKTSINFKDAPVMQFGSLELFKAKQQSMKCGHAQILVVDDNQFNILAMKQQLSKFHMKIDMAFSGKQAIELIQQRLDRSENACCAKTYMMIFMDIDMPVMNGYEATVLIQELFKVHGISQFECPVVACSAFVSPEDRNSAFASGMLDYIVKPVMLGTLDQVFTNWFVKKPKSALTLPDIN